MQHNIMVVSKLLQRGIRLNSKAEELWREYFRMEVLFTARLAERRRVLGLGKEAKKAATEAADGDGEEPAIAIGNLDEEAKGDSKDAVPLPDAQSVDAGLEDLLAGSIPRAVIFGRPPCVGYLCIPFAIPSERYLAVSHLFPKRESIGLPFHFPFKRRAGK